jgi:hypothetical protein
LEKIIFNTDASRSEILWRALGSVGELILKGVVIITDVMLQDLWSKVSSTPCFVIEPGEKARSLRRWSHLPRNADAGIVRPG